MYITSDLFGASTSHTHGENTGFNHRSPMADTQPSGGLGKRKRLDADSTPSKMISLHPHMSSVSKVSPHMRSTTSISYDGNRIPCSLRSASSIYSTSERRPVKQLKRLSPRSTLAKSNSHLMDIDPEFPLSVAVAAPPQPVSDLRPCHACQSAPKRKRDLENYLDCRRCDGRTCYICARQCYGGCGKAVCKKCIVEVGDEGDPWCLDCYARSINT